jgi:hypothetical protein
MSDIIQHSSASNEHGTPTHVIAAARQWMGSIDLDPASCAEANTRVMAGDYCGQDLLDATNRDGLLRALVHGWFGNVFLNPPGGKLRLDAHTGRYTPGTKGPGLSSQLVWYETLVRQWVRGNVKKAVFAAFNLEILRLGQSAEVAPQRFFRCYPKERLRFIPLGQPGKSGNSPSHANVIIGLPDDGFSDFPAFERAFGDIGFCEPGKPA